MYKPSSYQVIAYFPTYLPIYETKVKPNINSTIEVHPQLSNNKHPMDGVLVVGASSSSLCPSLATCKQIGDLNPFWINQ